MKENKKQELYEMFLNDGIAIFVKGEMVIGIHPDNVENDLKLLINGTMEIDWEALLQRVSNIKETGKQRAIITIKIKGNEND